MKKRLFVSVLILCLLLSAAVPAAYAEETTAATEETVGETTEATEAATEETKDPYACGDDLTWSYAGGVLTISGTGAMDDMSGGAPWAEYKSSITTVVFSCGVTTVGAYAFRNYDGIVAVDFGSAMREIDTKAFEDCDGLESISLPSTFRRFGKECFSNCSKLTKVYCAGGMPSFNANCLWNGNNVTVYCPTNNLWPASYVEELETNFGGRLTVLAADGSDPYDFTQTEPTKATTAPSEETEAPTTEPETVPETEETTVPETTEETTVPTTEETVETTEETEPEKQTAAKRTSGAVVIALIVMVLSAVGIGVILFYLRGNKGGKYAA